MIVKICGMKTEEAARAAETAGADLLGFIFYRGSRRYVAPERVKEISASVRHSKRVGVFVDAPVAEVNEIAEFCSLDYVQLHGHEDEAYARQVLRPVIKAYRYGDNFRAEEAEHYPAEIVLLDSFVKGEVGGTGQSFAWQEASRETAGLTKPLLVAGGISEENLTAVMETFHPYGVDVSGSLEEQGEKSVSRIHSFLKEAERWRG